MGRGERAEILFTPDYFLCSTRLLLFTEESQLLPGGFGTLCRLLISLDLNFHHL